MDIKQKIVNAKDLLEKKGNVIKTRDDYDLILVNADGTIQNPDDCDWGINDKDKVTNAIFRSRIEPWLTSLFQSEHLSLLCGSGISNAISHKAGANGGATMGATTFNTFKDEIAEAAAASAMASGRNTGNIEDQIRTANDLLRGLKILKKQSDAQKLETELNSIIAEFAKSILSSEKP